MIWGEILLSRKATSEQLEEAVANAFGIDVDRVYISWPGDGAWHQSERVDVTVNVYEDPDTDTSYPMMVTPMTFTGFSLPTDLEPVSAIVDRLGGHVLANPFEEGINEHYYYISPGRPPIEVEFDEDADDDYVLTPASLARIETEAA